MSNIQHLEELFTKEFERNKKSAAEIAYVIAVLAQKSDNLTKAKEFALKSISLFEELDIQNLERAASEHNSIEGVVIPEWIHEGVVRERFKDFLEPV